MSVGCGSAVGRLLPRGFVLRNFRSLGCFADGRHLTCLPAAPRCLEHRTRAWSISLLHTAPLTRLGACSNITSYIPFNYEGAVRVYSRVISSGKPTALTSPCERPRSFQSMFNPLCESWGLAGCNHRLRLGLKWYFTLEQEEKKKF